MIDSILTKLGDVSSRYEEIETLLSQPDITSNQEEYIKLSKEYSDLSPLVTAFISFKRAEEDIEEAKLLMKDSDPEIKQMVNGKSVARLSLATSQSWKDKTSGEKKEKTEWHRIVVFNEGLVNVVQQYLKKGAQIYVEGQITTRKWKDEQSGQDKYSTEIVIQGYNSSLTMLGGGNSGGGIQNDTTQTPAGNFEDAPQVSNDMDDEIPF